MSFDDFIGTRPVAPQHAFDVDALRRWLQPRMDGIGSDLTVEQFKGGQSNPTFRLSSGGRHFVLRRKPPGNLLPSAHAVDREFRVISALANTAVPVAGAHVLCEDPAVIGSMFYVMDCVEGRVLWDPALPRHEPRTAPRPPRRTRPRDRRAAQGGPGGRGPGRLRQARQLPRAPGRPLDQAVTAPPRPRPSTRWSG